jgi:uncharacterized protein with NAD-binding domain and iron-sulfur cluster
MSARRRVAILGGGAGGLTAAFELTATPELRERYEVTVHQLGWRLGGKGASGRREIAGGSRIEEHGLHVWFGFYENAFDVIKRVYAELDRPEGAALRTWDEAFHPTNQVVLLDDTEGEWRTRHFHFPENGGEPGVATDPPGFHRLLHDALRILREVEPPEEAPALLKAADKFIDQVLVVLESFVGGDDDRFELSDLVQGFARAAEILHLGKHEDGEEFPISRALRALRDFVWKVTGGDRYAMTFDLTTTVFRGILDDGLDEDGFGKVNHLEFTEWLASHGAKPETLAESPMLRAFYQLCFAYRDGDRTQPCVAAGKALQAMLRMCVGYRGSIMWKMQAGMGDAIFAPMYEVLRARGVRFRFFHEVTDIGLSADGDRVERIAIREQARCRGEYAPLKPDPGGLPCWPCAPDWEQLHDGAELAASGVAFEACEAPPGAQVLELRAGEDFDDVVLAMSVGSLEPVCGDLRAKQPRFATMLDNAVTVATQALQVWMTADREELGFKPEGMVSGAYVEPLDTLCDMSHLLGREGWPAADAVRSVGYFCGTMREVPGETQADADARARRDGLAHLRRNATVIWPGAATSGGEFDWTLLADPHDRAGEERIEAQYWRANIFGSERYVLTPPGSVEHRLRPDESGVENLVLAGDWTRNGVCGGSVEAAVTSGRLAARALSGFPAVVPGTEGWLETD